MNAPRPDGLSGPLEPDTVVGRGRYRVDAYLGRGAFSEVYAVTDLDSGVRKALKVVRAARGAGSGRIARFAERFARERLISDRVHDGSERQINVLRVYEDGVEGQAAYVVVELARGGSLADALDRCAAQGRTLDIDQAVQWLADAARGLQSLHRIGVVHVDLKPANVLIMAHGGAVVGDLGSAQLGAETVRPSDREYTPDYAAPEHGGTAPLTAAADVYSLGCVAFELLTGERWARARERGATLEALRPDAPEWMGRLVARMLYRDIALDEDSDDDASRYATMDRVLAALAKGDEGTGGVSPAPAPPPIDPRFSRAIEALNTGQAHVALPLLMELETEGFDAPAGNLEALIREAKRIKEVANRKRAADAEYARIAGLVADGVLDEARGRWSAFRRKYPEYGDPKGLDATLRQPLGPTSLATLLMWTMIALTIVVLVVIAWIVRNGEAPPDVSNPDNSPTEQAAAPHTTEQQALLDVMLDFGRPPEERAEAGRQLAAIGDPRPGVGLRPDGMPDIAWVEVPGGAFLMGDDDQPLWGGAWELQRTVEVPGFWMSRYETTWMQYEAFLMGDDGYRNLAWWEGLAERQDPPGEQSWPLSNHPVENVSWYDAVAYTRWLSARLGYEVRLPTEEEWEKAARGTDGRKYPWGDAYETGRANINERLPEDDPAGSHDLERTTAVGLYLQGNPYGIEDLAGNVWEWTLTDFNTMHGDALSSDALRAVRGGSWDGSASRARSAFRFGGPPHERVAMVGFRVASSAPSLGLTSGRSARAIDCCLHAEPPQLVKSQPH